MNNSSLKFLFIYYYLFFVKKQGYRLVLKKPGEQKIALLKIFWKGFIKVIVKHSFALLKISFVLDCYTSFYNLYFNLFCFGVQHR